MIFGAGGLLTASFCTGFPASNFRKHLIANSLRGFSPKALVTLCAGANDPTVFFANTSAIHDDFAARGITAPVWDVEHRDTMPEGSSYGEVFDGFQLAKLAAGNDVEAKYHAELVPFCHALARGFFATAAATQASR